jgi:hypothetical protein
MKNKALHRSAKALENKLRDTLSKWQRENLQYQAQDEDTKRHLYKACDELRAFCDNIS